MIRFIRTFSFLGLYLIYSIPALKKVKALPESLSVTDRDHLVHELPKRWSRGIMARTKSEIIVSGLENLDDEPALLVSNHEGNFDIPALIGHLPKAFGFMAKAELTKAAILSEWMKQMNCVFIDRTNRRSSLKSVLDAVEVLKNGHSLLIFPEGTRSKSDKVEEFKTGAVKIAQRAQVPIIPIAVSGTSELLETSPKGTIQKAVIYLSVLPKIDTPDILSADSVELTNRIKVSIIEEKYKHKRS